MLLCVPDPGGLEIRRYGNRQASALHLLPSDDSRNYRNPYGRAAYIRICGSRPNNRDLSREMRTRGFDFLWDLVISLQNIYGKFLHPEERCDAEDVVANVII
jgi:hypothetical protein